MTCTQAELDAYARTLESGWQAALSKLQDENEKLRSQLETVKTERDRLVRLASNGALLYPSSNFTQAEIAFARAEDRLFVASDGTGAVHAASCRARRRARTRIAAA